MIEKTSKMPEVGWKYSPSGTKLDYLKHFVLGNTVLEIGSGMGWYSKYLKDMGLSVTAIDINPINIIDGVEFIKEDFIKADLRGRFFETVIMFDVLEHIIDEELAFKKIQILCKKRLIMSVPNCDDVFLPKYNLTFSHYKDKTHFHEYSIDQIRDTLESNGFKLIKIGLEGPAKPQVFAEFLNPRIDFLKIPLRKFITLLGKCRILSPGKTGADIFIVAEKKTIK